MEEPWPSHDSHRREKHLLQQGLPFTAIFSFLTTPPPEVHPCSETRLG
jgi:hypothetical protein